MNTDALTSREQELASLEAREAQLTAELARLRASPPARWAPLSHALETRLMFLSVVFSALMLAVLVASAFIAWGVDASATGAL